MKQRLMMGWITLCLAVALACGMACAETITALAVTVNPEHLQKTATYARILGYNEERNTLPVELIVPEVFDGADVLALKAGDGIYTGGREVQIFTLDWDAEYTVLTVNGGEAGQAADTVCLRQDAQGNFAAERDGRPVYNTLVALECPVTNSLLFLDYVSAENGAVLDLPTVHTAAELVAALQEGELRLDLDNAWVVFDGEGQLALVQRR